MTITFHGADISHYQNDQGPIDWNLLHARSAGSLIGVKATQRNNFIDPYYSRNVMDAMEAGFQRIAQYHWLSPVAEASVASQVNLYLSVVGRLSVGEAVMLDAEQYGITTDAAADWLEAVEDVTLRPSLVYTGIYTDSGRMFTSSRIRNSAYGPRGIWLAAYLTEQGLAVRLQSLRLQGYPYHLWQYTSNGAAGYGIVGRFDMNMVLDFGQLDKCCGYAAQHIGESVIDIVRNAENDPPGFPGVPAGNLKLMCMEDGTLRHLTEDDLSARGITNSPTLGVPVDNAQITRMGYWVKAPAPVASPKSFDMTIPSVPGTAHVTLG